MNILNDLFKIETRLPNSTEVQLQLRGEEMVGKCQLQLNLSVLRLWNLGIQFILFCFVFRKYYLFFFSCFSVSSIIKSIDKMTVTISGYMPHPCTSFGLKFFHLVLFMQCNGLLNVLFELTVHRLWAPKHKWIIIFIRNK